MGCRTITVSPPLSRSLVMFSAVVSAYDNAHIRANNSRLQLAADYAMSAGDRVYGALASMYAIQTRFFTAEHRKSSVALKVCPADHPAVDELLTAAEEVLVSPYDIFRQD